MTRARDAADQINRVNSSAANATAITVDASENIMIGTTVAGRAAEGADRFTIADASHSGMTIRSGVNTYGSINFSDSEGGAGEYAGSIWYGHGTLGEKLVMAIQGSNKVTVDGDGLKFNNDTAAANALSDYEEGTWTPVFGGTSTIGTYTYGEQQGHYVKIGSQVTVWFNLTNIATVTEATGNMRITGLPFTINWQSGFNGEATGQLNMAGFTGLDGDTVWGQVPDGATHINVYFNSGTNNDTNALSVTSKTGNSSDVRGFATYMAD